MKQTEEYKQGFTDGNMSAFDEAKELGDFPIGVSQWKAVGIKYKYDKYFNIEWDMPSAKQLHQAIGRRVALEDEVRAEFKECIEEIDFYGWDENTQRQIKDKMLNNIEKK